MTSLFFYGTLQHLPLLQEVAGQPLESLHVAAAQLQGYVVQKAAGHSFPILCAKPGGQAHGIAVSGLTDEAMERLDIYEHDYTRHSVEVSVDGGAVPAVTYLPRPYLRAGGAWSLDDWRANWGEIQPLAAADLFDHLKTMPVSAALARWGAILTRAASRVNAQAAGPTTLRRAAAPGDVEILHRARPYANFFSVEEYDLRHRLFDGAKSAVLNRAVFVSGDAVTVLPWDRRHDLVLVVEQFRAGPLGRGDPQPWSLEAIAGRLDAGESPEQTARREAVEEAGVTLNALHPVSFYYPTPGAKSEFLYSYVAECDLSGAAADGALGGLDSEGEDIRSHVIPLAQLLKLIDSGEVQNAPLILTAWWLAMNRDRLVQDA